MADSGHYNGVKFVKVDVDECPQTSEACGITGYYVILFFSSIIIIIILTLPHNIAMPTFQFFIDGKKVGEMMGASEGGLKHLIDENSKK